MKNGIRAQKKHKKKMMITIRTEKIKKGRTTEL